VVPDATSQALPPRVKGRVHDAAAVYPDEWKSYDPLGKIGYRHSQVQHSQKVYLSGDVHTNTIEGFWSLLRRGIRGVSHGVLAKHLQSYLDDYTFRYNNRDAEGRGMFSAFLGFGKVKWEPDPSARPS
jgi:transposase-like protein